MKIYLDTGNIDEIIEASNSEILDGVTTNPTLIAKEGRDFNTEIKEIIKILRKNCSDDFTVSAEVTNLENSETIVKQARVLSKIDKHILVKVPLTFEGLKAVKLLSKEKIRCNVTLCFSANQALLAAKAGAWCVSPFVGRVDDTGHDGMELIEEIRLVFDNYKFTTRILAASIRSPEHILECAKIGADIVTTPYSIFKKLYLNPLTDIGLENFSKDWNEYQKNLKSKK